PLGRPQQAEDIAWATAFLASDYAREITGQVLTIDGGTTMV
ncbi:MAG: SDR family oxidoreductase, partial [Oscillospiraceae bacterium]|nr:SDR family oxidoreductase [Oscillospiraceae bacterium]